MARYYPALSSIPDPARQHPLSCSAFGAGLLMFVQLMRIPFNQILMSIRTSIRERTVSVQEREVPAYTAIDPPFSPRSFFSSLQAAPQLQERVPINKEEFRLVKEPTSLAVEGVVLFGYPNGFFIRQELKLNIGSLCFIRTAWQVSMYLNLLTIT